MSAIANFLATHLFVNIVDLCSIIFAIVVAIIIFNKRILPRRERTVTGFALLGVAFGCMLTMDWTPFTSSLGIVIIVLSVIVAIYGSRNRLKIVRKHSVKISPNTYRQIRLSRKAIHESPKIQKLLRKISEKADKDANYKKNGSYQMSNEDAKKLHEMILKKIKQMKDDR